MSGRPTLSASILSADFSDLGTAVTTAEEAGIDWIHVDVMDGHFVPNITMGPVVVSACRRVTQLPLDVHLMIEAPERMVPAFAEAGASNLTVHVEACPNLHRTLQIIHEAGCRAGVAVNPGTPAEAISSVLDMVDLILVMTVNPGYAGQAFIDSALPKVAALKEMRNRSGSAALIEVDGGVSASTAPLAARQGAEVFVAATAIFGYPGGIAAGINALRAALA